MTRVVHLALVAISTIGLGACASTPDAPMDTGDLITQRGDEISDYGHAWSAGQADVAAGQKMVNKGSKRLDSAQKQLADARAALSKAEAKVQSAEADRTMGQRLISEGKSKMLRAEEDYSVTASGPTATVTVIPE